MAPVKKRKTENQSNISSFFKKPRGTAVDKGDEPASKGKAENGIGEIGSSVVQPIAVGLPGLVDVVVSYVTNIVTDTAGDDDGDAHTVT